MTRRCCSHLVGAHPRFLVLLLLASAAAMGCRSRGEQTIKDTEGRVFASQCSEDRICVVTQKPGRTEQSPASGKATTNPEFKYRNAGRVVGICGPVAPGVQPAPGDCRPLLCESDGDCPAATGLSSGVCVNHLCTEPSHDLSTEDAVMLCLAGTGAGPRTAAQVERLALGLNCGKPCRIPRVCRQP